MHDIKIGFAISYCLERVSSVVYVFIWAVHHLSSLYFDHVGEQVVLGNCEITNIEKRILIQIIRILISWVHNGEKTLRK